MSNGRAIVVGAGIVGAACAMELARAGFEVQVVDPGPVGAGATGAGMGHLVVIDDPPAEFALTLHSVRRWNQLSRQLDKDCEYQRCGTLWIARDEEEMAEARAKAARLQSAGAACTLGDGAWVKRLEPLLQADLAGGLLVDEDAIIYAPAAARWMLTRAGVSAVDRRRVDRFGDHAAVLTDGTVLRADVLVNAAGLAARTLSPIRLRGRKGHLLITTRCGEVKHAIVELGYIKSAHGQGTESVAFNVQGRPNGQVLIGSSRQLNVEDARVEARMACKLVDRAIEFMPSLGGRPVLRTWTGVRAVTDDGQPVIDWDPEHRGVIIAAGHEGLGVTTSLGTADIVASLARGVPSPVDRTPFGAMRFGGSHA